MVGSWRDQLLRRCAGDRNEDRARRGRPCPRGLRRRRARARPDTPPGSQGRGSRIAAAWTTPRSTSASSRSRAALACVSRRRSSPAARRCSTSGRGRCSGSARGSARAAGKEIAPLSIALTTRSRSRPHTGWSASSSFAPGRASWRPRRVRGSSSTTATWRSCCSRATRRRLDGHALGVRRRPRCPLRPCAGRRGDDRQGDPPAGLPRATRLKMEGRPGRSPRRGRRCQSPSRSRAVDERADVGHRAAVVVVVRIQRIASIVSSSTTTYGRPRGRPRTP